MLWASQLTDKKYAIIADTPGEIRETTGPVGLTRTDHHFFLDNTLSLTRKYLSQKNNKRALTSLGKVHEQFYEKVWNALGERDIRIQLLNVPLQSFIPTDDERAIFGASYGTSNNRDYIKPAPWDVAMIYQMQTKAIMNTIGKSNASHIDIIVPQHLVGSMYNQCIDSLEKLTRKDVRVRISTPEESMYIVNSSKTLDMDKVKSSSFIIERPACLEKTAIKIAQSYLLEQDNNLHKANPEYNALKTEGLTK